MKLNSIYGLCVQNPIQTTIEYINDDWLLKDEDPEELLLKHNKKAFTVYAHGVWCSALARLELEKAIKHVGYNFVYCDTDSVKFIDDGTISFDKYNKARKEASIKNGGYATDPKGKTHYLGLYEHDSQARRFITMGAKKYAYEDESGELHITVAGVSKSVGAKELTDRGGLEAFKEGFTFYKAGGTESVYNDITEPFNVDIDGKQLKITSNVLIRDSQYTLGLTGEYKRILSRPDIWLALLK